MDSAAGKEANVDRFKIEEIIFKDDKSATIKLRNSGSKIVFFSDLTEIFNLAKGNLNDLVIGKNISINGAVNPDGSIIA